MNDGVPGDASIRSVRASGFTGPAASDARRISSLAALLEAVGREFEGRYFWHRSHDSYVLFLAEFFLRRSNRTTVERFLPGFIERFPDARSLAAAEPDEVVVAAAWAGLRKRTSALPQVIARFMERDHWTSVELRSLPYLGAYGADSIALYLFGEPTFPVDNNVRRVVGRWLGLEDEQSLIEAITELLSVSMARGGAASVRLVHLGTLALGWDSCRSVPTCTTCPFFNGCCYRLELERG